MGAGVPLGSLTRWAITLHVNTWAFRRTIADTFSGVARIGRPGGSGSGEATKGSARTMETRKAPTVVGSLRPSPPFKIGCPETRENGSPARACMRVRRASGWVLGPGNHQPPGGSHRLESLPGDGAELDPVLPARLDPRLASTEGEVRRFQERMDDNLPAVESRPVLFRECRLHYREGRPCREAVQAGPAGGDERPDEHAGGRKGLHRRGEVLGASFPGGDPPSGDPEEYSLVSRAHGIYIWWRAPPTTTTTGVTLPSHARSAGDVASRPSG